MGHRLGSILKPLVVEPVSIFPAESKVLIDLQSYSVSSLFQIVAMGVTQHPDTTYTYLSDGVQVSVPVPLGTFYHPIYTCQVLGGYIDVQEQFKVIVSNNGDRAHKYAALVWYNEGRY